MSFYELSLKRRSTRGFTGAELSDDQINNLMKSAVNAPNACNLQAWHFYCLKSREMIEGLVPSVYKNEWIKKAGAVFVVCTDDRKLYDMFGERGRDLFSLQDTACAADHILLSAADMGLGSCFIGAFDENECKKYLDIPDFARPVALLPAGYASGEFPKRERKNIDEVFTVL